MIDMIQRRTLLSALPFVFVSACARAQASQQPAVKAADMTGMSGSSLGDLVGGVGKVAWLTLTGSVRLTAANANARPATLHRALMMNADGTSARLFDVWQVTGGAAVAGPSVTSGAGRAETGPNDLGDDGVWLKRSFTHGALQTPIENSRLTRTQARVMAIDATQVWLLEGGVVATAPTLTGPALAAFEAWRAAA